MNKFTIVFMIVLFLSTINAHGQISEFKISASDGAQDEIFGHSVSISGDYAIVGANWDDENGSRSGSAYVFKRTGTSWTQETKLLASDGAAGDQFGWSASISGDYVIVGAWLDDDNGDNSGSAYVFKRTDTSWTEEAKLLPSDGASGDWFGYSVSISGDYAVVGADLDDDNGDNSGSAYVFKRTGTSWMQEAKLLASDGAAGDDFGSSISISGDYAVVAAEGDDDNGSNTGSAYVFKRTGTSWAEETKLQASDSAEDDLFGISVSISGDYAVVGAWLDDDNGIDAGSAYVFKRSGTSWMQEAKLLASDGAAGDWFGSLISISGDYVIVGAFLDSVNGIDVGSAYVFKRTGTSWMQEAKLLASDGAAGDWFGISVSISSVYAIVGAINDDDNGERSGSAYVYSGFNLSAPPFVSNPIQDIAVNEDFGSISIASLDNVFGDPNLPNDSLRFIFSISSGIVSGNISRDTLWLFSVPDSNGMAEVVVTATDDSSASVSDSFNVTIIAVGVDDEIAGIPKEFTLYQNYPNPFNPVTTISYALPKTTSYSLIIYALMGREVMRWSESDAAPGFYRKLWNGTNKVGITVSTGVYIYRLTAGDFVQTRKMVLLK